MKTLRKIAVFILCLMMTFSMSGTAFAQNTPGADNQGKAGNEIISEPLANEEEPLVNEEEPLVNGEEPLVKSAAAPSSLGNPVPTPAPGQILIPFTKEWEGDSPADRPASITVKLYKYLGTFNLDTATLVGTKTVTADNNWACTFDISNEPLYEGTTYSPDKAYKFKVVEDNVSGYTETAHTDPNVVFNPPEITGGWEKIEPCNELNIDISEYNKDIVLAKKGHDCVVWSPDPLSAEEREVIKNSASKINGIGNPKTYVFFSGFGKIPGWNMEVTNTETGTTVKFSNPEDWSLLALGQYNKSTTETNASSITNTKNTYGSLTVSKVLAGNDTDSNKDFSFTVTLEDTNINGTYGGMTFNNGVATFKLKGGEEKTATGLPSGTVYEVVETPADGYVTTKTGDTGTIAGDQTKTAKFTNTRNTYGDLTVEKVLAGNDTDKTKDFSFTVTLEDTNINGTYGGMTFNNGVATFKLKGGESKTATGLPNGLGYTVTEDDYAGYNQVATGDTGTIAGDQTKTAKFTNTRNTYGDLTVEKVLAGNDTDKTKDFSFTVTLEDTNINGTYGGMTFNNGVATFKLKGGESKTATGLPNGLGYTVTEKDYEGYVTTKTGDTGNIVGNDKQNVTFTNTRDTFGNLTVKKTVDGASPIAGKKFNFTVTLKDKTISDTYGDMTFADGVATFSLEGGEEKTATDLPNGMGYTVTEDDYSGDGYVTTRTDDYTGAIKGNKTLTAEFTNTRNANGSLTVSKKLAGNDPEANKEFEFTVTLQDKTISGTYGGMTFNNGVATFKLKGGEYKTATGLPDGMQYEVNEASVDGYNTTKTDDYNGTIDEKSPKVVTFTNTRDTFGKLTVSKVLAGNDPEADKEFEFTVTLKDKTISDTYGDMTFNNGVATFTLKGGESATASNLPNGLEYTVTEKDYEGYVTTKTGDTGNIVGNDKQNVTFTNTRDTFGKLTVSKVLAGKNPDTTKEFEFTITLFCDSTFSVEALGDSSTTARMKRKAINGAYGEMEFTDGVATFTLKGGESKTAENLPNGVSYCVTEKDYTADGYVTSKTGNTGAIVGNDEQTATFTNTKNATGILTVTNAVTGNDADTNKDFEFTVTLNDTTINGEYGEMEFTDGVATFILKDGEEKTATGLPDEMGYKIEERDYTADGYETTNSTNTGNISSGTISADSPAKVDFINEKNILDPDDPQDPDPDDPIDPEDPVDNDDGPSTGDDSNIGLWLGGMALSLTGLAALLLSRRRRDN